MKNTFTTAALILAASTSIAAAQTWSAEIYGGSSFKNSIDFALSPNDVDTGTALGIGIYYTGWVPGLEIGLDVMATSADFTMSDGGLDSRSLMLNARYAFPLGQTAEAYVGAGLGAIELRGVNNVAIAGSDQVNGGQIELGLRYKMAAGNLFTAVKHQAAFDDAMIHGFAVGYDNTSVIVGFGFRF
jgi:opacity protein-like surface antigen